MVYVADAGPHGYSDAPPDAFTLDPIAAGQNVYQHPTTSSMQDPNSAAYYHQNAAIACDIKPRLTKEQHDILEAHYKQQSKPNTNTKKGFADALNVPLDKVNNWFQNRRAKSKQDLKKQNEQANFPVQTPSNSLHFSDSDTSPSFPSADYFSMMQNCPADDQTPSGMSMHHDQNYDMSSHQQNLLSYVDTNTRPDGHHVMTLDQFPQDMFDSPLDMHRRTLTQEQFDAFVQNGIVMQSGEQYEPMPHGFAGHDEALRQAFLETHQGDMKQPLEFAFPAPMGEPLSSNESSISSSTLSEQGMFPSSTTMQEQAAIAAPASDFSNSRSSSLSQLQDHEGQYLQSAAPPSQSGGMSTQWQPGQSVPVDPNALHQHVREVEQRQMLQQQQHQQHQQMSQQDQTLEWSDDAFARRDSHSGTMLAQQMSSFGIETPQPPQSATFKSPPPSSIAARRQRPRPAALGLASLRSQSYSGAMQPSSPGHVQQTSLTPGLPLRRIRSSNVINGVAAGRVVKPIPGSAQRSPLNYTFADGIQAPKGIRHSSSASAGNLAPPTPLSPGEGQRPDQQTQVQSRPSLHSWQSASSQVQASISETESEHNPAFDGPTAMPAPQNFTSPPHTPSYQSITQPHFVPPRPHTNIILENTPPQSAPASQQTFFLAAQASQAELPPSQHVQVPQYHLVPSQPQHLVQAPGPEQYHHHHHHHHGAAFAPEQQYILQAAPPMHNGVQYQFANGVPMVNDQGQLTMAFPPQVAPMPQMHFVTHGLPQGHEPQLQPTPPMTQYSFVPTDGIMSQAQVPKLSQPSELFVHEYSPPQDVKRAAVPRKTVDTGPKNYTFANHGPEHFEKDKAKKNADGKSSSPSSESPASV